MIPAAGDTLAGDCFPRTLFHAAVPAASVPEDLTRLTYSQIEVASDASTRVYVERLLVLFNGNVTRAAVHAGIERRTLHRLLRRHLVSSGGFKDRGLRALRRKNVDPRMPRLIQWRAPLFRVWKRFPDLREQTSR